MITINKQKAIELIRGTNGGIFSVSFYKKDSSLREMNCRLGVKKHLHGGKLAFDALEKGLIPVFDLKKAGYRMINLNTIIELKCNKETYKVV